MRGSGGVRTGSRPAALPSGMPCPSKALHPNRQCPGCASPRAKWPEEGEATSNLRTPFPPLQPLLPLVPALLPCSSTQSLPWHCRPSQRGPAWASLSLRDQERAGTAINRLFPVLAALGTPEHSRHELGLSSEQLRTRLSLFRAAFQPAAEQRQNLFLQLSCFFRAAWLPVLCLLVLASLLSGALWAGHTARCPLRLFLRAATSPEPCGLDG